MNIQELKLKSSEQLITQAEELGIENASTLRKQEILFAILKKVAEKEEITGAGVLQLLQDGFGFLRAMEWRGRGNRPRRRRCRGWCSRPRHSDTRRGMGRRWRRRRR